MIKVLDQGRGPVEKGLNNSDIHEGAKPGKADRVIGQMSSILCFTRSRLRKARIGVMCNLYLRNSVHIGVASRGLCQIVTNEVPLSSPLPFQACRGTAVAYR